MYVQSFSFLQMPDYGLDIALKDVSTIGKSIKSN